MVSYVAVHFVTKRSKRSREHENSEETFDDGDFSERRINPLTIRYLKISRNYNFKKVWPKFRIEVE